MPCTGGGGISYEASLAEENNKLTALLCKACSLLEDRMELPEDLKAWDEAHKAKDQKRKDAEQKAMNSHMKFLLETREQLDRELNNLLDKMDKKK